MLQLPACQSPLEATVRARRFACGGALALLTSLAAVHASAHLRLEAPAPRYDETHLKYGPCGMGPSDARSTDPARITTLAAGSTITVRWVETVDHDPAHYRIMFGPAGQTDLVDPSGYDDTTTVYPELLDGIPDAEVEGEHTYSAEVTLPSEPCDACVLQVIQVMHDKPPWGPEGGDDIYYQCADLVLTEPGTGPASSGGAPSAGTGGEPTNPATSPTSPTDGPTQAAGGTASAAAGSAPPIDGGGGCAVGLRQSQSRTTLAVCSLALLLVGLCARRRAR